MTEKVSKARHFDAATLAKDRKRAARTVAGQLGKPGTLHPIADFNLRPDQSSLLRGKASFESALSAPFHANQEDPKVTALFESLSTPKLFTDKETGQVFQVVESDGRESGTRPVLYLPGFGVPVSVAGPPQLRAAAIVEQTGRSVVTIDYPGFGSDPLTKEQKDSLAKGDYSKVAEAQLRILQQMGITDLDLVGESMGAWANAAIAARAKDFGITVHNLVMIEPPLGNRLFGGLSLMLAEGSEGSQLDLYSSTPYNQKLREVGSFDAPLRRRWQLAKWAIGGMKKGYPYIRAMAKNMIETYVDTALDSNPDLLAQVIHGTEGKVSKKEADREMVQRLKEKYRGRISRSVYPGDSHPLMENPDRFGTNIRLALLATVRNITKGKRDEETISDSPDLS